MPRTRLSTIVPLCLLAACEGGVTVPSGSDLASAPSDFAATDRIVDLARPVDAPLNCADPVQPSVTVLFGPSPHVPARQVLQLSDSALFTCNALDGTPGCSCMPPCSCWSLTITLPSQPSAGQYQLSELGATYAEQHSAQGGWMSTNHAVTDGILTLFEVEADGIVGVVCGVVAKGVGEVGVAGIVNAAACR